MPRLRSLIALVTAAAIAAACTSPTSPSQSTVRSDCSGTTAGNGTCSDLQHTDALSHVMECSDHRPYERRWLHLDECRLGPFSKNDLGEECLGLQSDLIQLVASGNVDGPRECLAGRVITSKSVQPFADELVIHGFSSAPEARSPVPDDTVRKRFLGRT